MERPSFTDEEALAFHAGAKPGKIEIAPTKPMATQRDLSLAYSPGVAVPVRAIAANPDAAFSRLIYALTFPFITPFAGVFPDSGASGSVLELSTILAMIMYPLFCWIIVRVVRLTNHRRGATPTTN